MSKSLLKFFLQCLRACTMLWMPDAAAFNNHEVKFFLVKFCRSWIFGFVSSPPISSKLVLSKYLFTVSRLLFPFVTLSIVPPPPPHPPQRDKDFWSKLCKIDNFIREFSVYYKRLEFCIKFRVNVTKISPQKSCWNGECLTVSHHEK